MFTGGGNSEGVIMAQAGWATNHVFKRYDIISETDMQDATRRLEDYRAQQSTEAAPVVIAANGQGIGQGSGKNHAGLKLARLN